jgi:hypothetical protein
MALASAALIPTTTLALAALVVVATATISAAGFAALAARFACFFGREFVGVAAFVGCTAALARDLPLPIFVHAGKAAAVALLAALTRLALAAALVLAAAAALALVATLALSILVVRHCESPLCCANCAGETWQFLCQRISYETTVLTDARKAPHQKRQSRAAEDPTRMVKSRTDPVCDERLLVFLYNIFRNGKAFLLDVVPRRMDKVVRTDAGKMHVSLCG